MECKRCTGDGCVRNGMVRGKQRWLCKTCGCNFTEGDRRRERTTPQQKVLAVLLVSMGLSFREAGKIVGVATNTVMVWFRKFAESVELQDVQGRMDVMEMDEMWRFIQKKSAKAGTENLQRLLLVQLDSAMSKWGAITLEP